MSLSVSFEIEVLNLIAQALFGTVLAGIAQSDEKPSAMMLFVDDSVPVGIDGDAWCARTGHDVPPSEIEEEIMDGLRATKLGQLPQRFGCAICLLHHVEGNLAVEFMTDVPGSGVWS
jgi:hypothetical protein